MKKRITEVIINFPLSAEAFPIYRLTEKEMEGIWLRSWNRKSLSGWVGKLCNYGNYLWLDAQKLSFYIEHSTISHGVNDTWRLFAS